MLVRRAPAVLALGSALLLTACGGGDSAGTTDLDAASAAPTTTASASPADGARERSATELFEAIAAAQERAQTSRFASTTTAAGVEVSGSGVARTGADPAFDVTMALPADAGLPGGEVQLVLVGGELFFRLPGAEAEVGAAWVKAAPDGSDPLSQALAPAFDSLQQAASPDFSIYEAAALAWRGDEQVDGVTATAYDFTVDVAAAAAAATGAQQEQLEQLADSGVTTLTGRVWVDGDDLVRKYVTEVTVAGATATSTVTFSGYGEPVEIAAPPADQVVDASTLE